MPEPTKGSDVQRTIAVRVSPAEHAQLVMVAQIDGITLVELYDHGSGQVRGRTAGGARLPGKGPSRTDRSRTADGTDPRHAPRRCSCRGQRCSGRRSRQTQGRDFRLKGRDSTR